MSFDVATSDVTELHGDPRLRGDDGAKKRINGAKKSINGAKKSIDGANKGIDGANKGIDGAKRDIDSAGAGMTVPVMGGFLRLRQFYFHWRLPAFCAMFGDNRGVDTAPYIELGA